MTTNEPTESKARQLFELALSKAPAERRAFLDGMGGTNAELRRRVEALLKAHEELGEFLAEPTAGRGRAATVGEAEGTVIGNYKLLQAIGEGGMGTVWMAEQFEPVRRKVALKIIKLGMDTKQVVARFEAERQALALMDHPFIAKVLDGGMTVTGRPYFVMELVKGMPITEFCDELKLSLHKRLDLFSQVCQAIQHAHGKGIIHRDIKPSNVLVTLHDGVPVPKVIDFGVAKAINVELTQKTLFTEHQQILGTPEYMSPEQTSMSGLDVDTRADVYSLGVLLYELLSGTKPFDLRSLLSEGYGEVLRTIREEDPPKPSTRASTMAADTGRISLQRQLGEGQLGKALRGDLDWIVMRCIEKDRERRYETASGLAMDIARFLQGEPVLAAPPSAAYRLRKFVRRHKLAVGASSAVVLALVLGVVGTTVGMTRAIAQSERAERAEEATARELARAKEVKGLLTQMILGIKPEEAQGFDTQLLKQIVDEASKRLESGEVHDERIAAEMHALLGNAYATIGEYEAAAKHLPKAVEIRTRLLGAEDADTLEARAQLALLYGYQGRYAESARILEEVVPRAQALYGEAPEKLLVHLQNLSTMYWNLFEVEKAEKYALLTYEIAKRERGEDDGFALGALNNLAGVRRAQGRDDEALEIWLQVLAAHRRVQGPDHPDLVLPLANLGHAYTQLDRTSEAEPYIEEARRLSERVLEEKSGEALEVASKYAALRVQQGKLAEARSVLSRVLEILGRHYAPEHRLNLDAKLLLARVCAYEGREADAAQLVGEGLALAQRVMPERSPRAVNYRLRCGDVYKRLGRYADARKLAEPVLELRRAKLGPDHVDTLSLQGSVAYARAALGDAAGGVRDVVEAHERVVATLGADDPRSDRLARMRAFVVARAGRPGEAEALYRESLARAGTVGGLRAAVLGELAEHCAAYGKLEEALALRREAVELYERLSGPTGVQTLCAKRDVALCLHGQGQYAEALSTFEQVLTGLREAVGAESVLTLVVECQASLVLGAQKDFEAAERRLLDVIARAERQWGKEHLVTVAAHRNLGMVYMDWRRIPDAERCLDYAVRVQEKVSGAPLVEDLDRLAQLARVRGATEAAAAYRSRAVKTARDQRGPKDPALVKLLADLADAERATGNREAARRALSEALSIARASLPESDGQRLRVLGALAALAEADDMPEQVVALLQELIAGVRQAEGEGSVAELGHVVRLALALKALGRMDEAERTVRAGIEDGGKRLGANSPPAARLQLTLATLYEAQGRWTEALQAVDDSEPGIRAAFGPDSLLAQLVRFQRAICLVGMGRFAEAIPVLEPVASWARKAIPPGVDFRTEVTSLLARAYDEVGETEKAGPLIAEVVPHQLKAAGEPKADSSSLASAARSLLYEGNPSSHDPKRALQLAQQACTLAAAAKEPGLWETLQVLARAQAQTGDAAGARGTLRQARALAPEGRRPEVDALARKLSLSED